MSDCECPGLLVLLDERLIDNVSIREIEITMDVIVVKLILLSPRLVKIKEGSLTYRRPLVGIILDGTHRGIIGCYKSASPMNIISRTVFMRRDQYSVNLVHHQCPQPGRNVLEKMRAENFRNGFILKRPRKFKQVMNNIHSFNFLDVNPSEPDLFVLAATKIKF